MKITSIKNIENNKIEFFKNGKKVYPISISGNQAEFKSGEIVLF